MNHPRGRRPVVVNVKHKSSDPTTFSKRNELEAGGDGKIRRKEFQLLEDPNHQISSISNLQSEVLELKAELDKAQSLNAHLQSHNTKLSQDLAAAHAKIAALTMATSHQRRESVADDQIPRFKDIQKLIATKLEFSKVNKEAINDASTATARAFAHVHKNVSALPPPPPPPPPPARPRVIAPKAPALAEYCHSSTQPEQYSKYPSRSRNHDKPATMSAHSSIVGEIQKRSSHLLAIKADIETKGEFINSLIQKVQDASYTNIEDVAEFVNWLDNQLSSLADERAVLKHFKWPEKKSDAMREAAVEHRGLKLLESEISSYKDDPSISCGVALKKMAGLLDKSEQSIRRLIKLRNSVVLSYQHYNIPTDWMLDSGIISKIKQASMMLAKIYMKRVAVELESSQYSERESTQGGLLLQGVNFAYRAHQFAGGLDSETLCAFEDIRKRVPEHLRRSQELSGGILSS
ncbi:protein CHUP1, chloroplastic [Actinidia eriantha]|uniref:protein CHUP1, chloroplastic n=1 Tax=Actinidia eriantha TaxID=165200 RepID=UPI0025851CAA|nr:protein CHUP1, chloroplastic [Actinidia eriantha]